MQQGVGSAGLDRSADGGRTYKSGESSDRRTGTAGRSGLRYLLNPISLMLSTVFLVSCASAIPPARIGDYISSDHQAGDDAFARVDQRPLQAGLVVVSDMAEPGVAPNLPEEAFARLRESLQRDLDRAIPVAITEVIPADQIRQQPHGDWAQFAELGQQRRLDYLVVVVVSSTEQEYPVTLFLGGGHACAAWISSR